MVMDILREKNNLTVGEDGRILVVPSSQYEFKTAPINQGDNALWVPNDVYIGLLLKLYQFDENLTNVKAFDPEGFKLFKAFRVKRLHIRQVFIKLIQF